MFKPLRNTLTITDAKEILCAEHAARLFVAEAWWAIVPSGERNPLSFASSGDAHPFWALITATLELGMPLGFEKIENKLRKLVNTPHTDPEKVLRNLIKVQPRASIPNLEIIKARCKITGNDPKVMYAEAKMHYDAEVAAEMARIEEVIKDIMRQQPASGEAFESLTKLGAFNEETGEYDEYEVTAGEWEIPIDRVIDFGEKQVKFLANSPNVPDIVFGTENALWEGELNQLAHIVQEREQEGAGEGSRALDEALLNGAGMAAGMNSGK